MGILQYADQVGLRCKVRAQDIADNSVWYLLSDEQAWISARYVVQTGTVPLPKRQSGIGADPRAVPPSSSQSGILEFPGAAA